MNTIHIHNVVSAQLTPVRTMCTSPIDDRTPGRQFSMRDLILVDDAGRKTSITIFADAPQQLTVEAAQ